MRRVVKIQIKVKVKVAQHNNAGRLWFRRTSGGIRDSVNQTESARGYHRSGIGLSQQTRGIDPMLS